MQQQVFGHKLKNWTSLSLKSIKIDPKPNINVWTKFNDNAYKSFL